MRVFVLLFNAGTDNEGIHSVNIGERNIILMFESEDDATRYAMQLSAQDFPEPSVEPIDDDQIKGFCQDAGYEWEVIPQDWETIPEKRAFLIPPERNLEQTDWQADAPKQEIPEESPQEQEMSDAELDRIRRQFEGLL
ncbi:MAG: DUF3110 domain-containing protein [Nostocaceae cyanobacterium]|nr:DUF3110 domain-containing protein [Nostocaceae cyanobacterium]